jgi:hydrogenase/urease accessory protein HupE
MNSSGTITDFAAGHPRLRLYRADILRCSWILGFSIFSWTIIFGDKGYAHPVAQGAMIIRVSPVDLEIVARVSVEEVFVASALSRRPDASDSLSELWMAHGKYLLQHFHLFVAGQLLEGVLIKAQPPSEGKSSSDQAVYTFSYRLPKNAGPTSTVELREDVLEGLDYAPGNPWTASYVVSIEHSDRDIREGLLLDRQQSLSFPVGGYSEEENSETGRISWVQVLTEYFAHGLWHIFTGYDHMLFMGAIALAACSIIDLIKVVSAFTLAHSITLTLSVLNVVRLPERIVEPLIAGSIVVVAVQNVLKPAQARGWIRLGVAFFFGLFHGLGFAGGLLEAMAGLPAVAIGIALVGFSLGVETAQQAVVLPTFLVIKLLHSARPTRSQPESAALVRRFGSIGIAICGVFYLCEALTLPQA